MIDFEANTLEEMRPLRDASPLSVVIAHMRLHDVAHRPVGPDMKAFCRLLNSSPDIHFKATYPYQLDALKDGGNGDPWDDFAPTLERQHKLLVGNSEALYWKDTVFFVRASRPGGQNVNKTESAVRAVHWPTRLSVVSQDQRSQFANKKLARLKLAIMFEEQRMVSEANSKTDVWHQSQNLVRGNEVRCSEGSKFKRTN